MRKILYFFIIAFGLISCNQFTDVADVEKVATIEVKIKINRISAENIPAPTKFKVKFNNYAEGFESIQETDSNGDLLATGLIPGIYSVTASAEVSDESFTYNFNGNLVNTSIFSNLKEYVIDVSASKSGNIIFKEIYYCGSKTDKGGSYFRDQYYELYNNSNEVQYLDSLCIGNMLPLTATANLYVWPGDDADKYVYFASIWQIPGTGKDYPLQPGESAIIAQMADNHQREALNPACPVNLITAEFETLVNTTSLIKDNPAINMNLAFWPTKTPQWLVTVFGGAYSIFYPHEQIDPNTYTNPVGSSLKAKKIAIDLIVDAVELVNDETKIKLKRVPAVLDAGATTVGAIYCGKSVSRKIKETLKDGRIIYADTNNSSEDFEINPSPVIRRNNAKIPAWNTWAN